MNGIAKFGLIVLCGIMGFGGASLLQAEPRFVNNEKIEAKATAADAATTVCYLVEQNQTKTTCTVDNFMSRINVVNMKTSGKDAETACYRLSDLISKYSTHFLDLGWTISITKRGSDKPLAICGIR